MAGVKGRSGRPRLSAEEHRIRGTYRADRHGPLPDAAVEVPEDAQDRPAPAPDVEPPPGLSKGERKHWAYFAPLLVSARVLTPSDRETLTDYCRACVAVEDRNRRLAKEFRKRFTDNQVVRMLDTQLRGWITRKTALATELGLTAVSRARIGWTGHPPQPVAAVTLANPLDKFLHRARPASLSRLAQLQAQAAGLRQPLRVLDGHQKPPAGAPEGA